VSPLVGRPSLLISVDESNAASALAEHGAESMAAELVGSVDAVCLDKRHSLPYLSLFRRTQTARLLEHGRGGVDEGDVVARPRQQDGQTSSRPGSPLIGKS
jgi:hypothetical protein